MRTLLLLLLALTTFETHAQLALSQDSNKLMKLGAHYERTINYGTYVGGSLSGSNLGLNGSSYYDNYSIKCDYGAGFELGIDFLFLPFKNVSFRVSPSYQHLLLSATATGRIVAWSIFQSQDTSYVTEPLEFSTWFIEIPFTIQYYFNKSKQHSFYISAGMSIIFQGSDVVTGNIPTLNSLVANSSSSSFLIGGIGYLHTLGKEATFDIEPLIKHEIITNSMVRYLLIGIRIGLIAEPLK